MYRTPCFPSSFFFFPYFLPLSSFPLFLSLPLSPCTTVSKVYNRVLALDEVVQFTEEDEWAYHEMAANIPLFSHPNPRSVSGSYSCKHIGAVMSVHMQLFPLPPAISFLMLSSPSSSTRLLLPHLILYLVPLLQFLSCLHWPLPPYLPYSPLPPSLPISQGAGGRRGRWRCFERGCQAQDSG